MDLGLLAEYSWVLLVLIALEGLLAADNAIVLAIMVKNLPEVKRRKALFYGLLGAFVLRFVSLFVISYLVNVWQVQAIGAAYLLFISIQNIVKRMVHKKTDSDDEKNEQAKVAGFWTTVLKVEMADMAFAVDSILAAVALAVALPSTGLPDIGGLDGGKFLVVFAGGMIGVIMMRFAANFFVSLLHRRPSLEVAAYLIVGWVGIKLAITTLSHPSLAFLPEEFSHSPHWKVTFYVVLILLAVGGWFFSKSKKAEEHVA